MRRFGRRLLLFIEFLHALIDYTFLNAGHVNRHLVPVAVELIVNFKKAEKLINRRVRIRADNRRITLDFDRRNLDNNTVLLAIGV